MTAALLLLAAYFVGAFPTSHVAAKLGGGIDLRQHGSKNVGATNLFRVLGWKYAVPAGLLDVAKGALPVAFFPPAAGTDNAWFPLAVAGCAVFGHVYSVFLRFKGGKGVATAAGALLALAPRAFLLSLAIWLIVLAGTGFVSLASILAAVAFPIAAWITTPEATPTLVVGSALAGFIVFTHRSNIRRLLAGTENRFRRRRGEA